VRSSLLLFASLSSWFTLGAGAVVLSGSMYHLYVEVGDVKYPLLTALISCKGRERVSFPVVRARLFLEVVARWKSTLHFSRLAGKLQNSSLMTLYSSSTPMTSGITAADPL
jgi:hypothetical protein